MIEQEDPGCYFHGEEPIPETYYRICIECGHCYVTAEELVTMTNDIRYEMWMQWEQGLYPWIPDTNADQIFCCAYCAHDF